jgi:DNA-binding beta-propeller fold protein YncE
MYAKENSMNPPTSMYSGKPLLQDPGRRAAVMRLSGLMMSGAALTTLGACAAPPPEAPEIDPSSLVYPPPPEVPRFYYEHTIWGSSSVIEETSTDRFRRFATGQGRRGEGMAKPFGIAAHNGRVFVSDTVTRYVHVFDFPQERYFTIGRRGVGRLVKPLGIAVDMSGKIYVVDATAARVLIYDSEGKYVTAVGIDSGLERPTGVAVTPDGQKIYVVNTGGVRSINHRVLAFDPRGRLVQTIGTRGTDDGEFNLPLDCALGPDGKLYVLDTGNFRVQVFDADGSIVQTFGEAGRFPGQFGHPKGITVDAEGKIYISDTNFGIFQIFNSEGRILMSVGQRSESGGPGKFILPAGISVDADQRIYVVDQFFQKIEVFRPAAVPDDWPIGQSVA